jgi:hypothetical protein
MRRVTSFIGITLLALLASGWGNALAAALCPKMQVASCCLTKTTHDSAPSHEAMAMDGMTMDSMAMMPAAEAEANSAGQPAASCAHCLSSPDLPFKSVVTVNSVRESERNLSAPIAAPVLRSLAEFSSSFAPPISSRQHAPPGSSTSLHVLINVFLI